MCHNTDRINKAGKDPSGWRATVEKMMCKGGRGGNVSANINMITDYLIKGGAKGQQAAK
jgi:hypothetical protein